MGINAALLCLCIQIKNFTAIKFYHWVWNYYLPGFMYGQLYHAIYSLSNSGKNHQSTSE